MVYQQKNQKKNFFDPLLMGHPVYRFRCALSVFIVINTERAHLNLYIDGGFETRIIFVKKKN